MLTKHSSKSPRGERQYPEYAKRIGVFSVWPAFVLAALVAASAHAQSERKAPAPINHTQQEEIIDSVVTTLNQYYVFPDVAQQMEKYVRERYAGDHYDTLTDPELFTRMLTGDLREVCHDRHLWVRYQLIDDDYIVCDTLTDDERQQALEEEQRNNFGFQKLELLPGGIGYLKFNQFADADWAGETAIAAMNFFAYCDALIIDLRDNGGGSPSMIQLISSYFFDEQIHLNSFYIRETDSIKQFWTTEFVQGPRLSDVDLYVLTSRYTFSAAEEFTYNLRNLERATIIGETTGGGAHPVDRRIFPTLDIAMSVPFGRAINPITGTNWEGSGIAPHIGVPREQALARAHAEALTKLLASEEDEDRKFGLKWHLDGLEAELHPVTVDDAILKRYVGSYGPRTITLENGELYYQREDRPKNRMIPMAADLFRFEELDYFRLQVVTDGEGNPTELRGLYDNGHTDASVRSGD